MASMCSCAATACRGRMVAPLRAAPRPAGQQLQRLCSLASSRKHQRVAQLVCTAAAVSLAEAPSLTAGKAFPGTPGVYAIYDANGTLQYIGITRKINLSVSTHREALPELVASIKYLEVPGGDKESLTTAWKEWVEEAVAETGTIPPGNAPGDNPWKSKPRTAKPEIRLTPGKGIQDLTCSIEDLIDAVIKTNKVVAFVKGTRTSPSCGFSYKVLTILNELGVDYEVVDVLDEVYNPGVREAIKQYSQWPTIPQIYHQGEFLGGADILEQMHASGELRDLLKK